VGVTLSGELAGLLAEAGGRWPQADEDRLHELAGSWRSLAERLNTTAADGSAVATAVTSQHSGAAIDAFSSYWNDLRGDIERAAVAAEQVAVGVDAMAKGTLAAKKSIVGALEATHTQIQAVRSTAAAAIIGPAIGWLLRILLQFVLRILGALLKLIWRAIVWLFKKVVEFFKWLWNKLFGKKPATPTRPTYSRTGKLPHARDLLKNGKEYTGRRLPNQAQPNSVLYKRDPQTGQITNYTVYDDAGNAIKRVDLTGRSHGGVPTPHVVEYTVHRNPHTGQVFVREGRTARPATPEEIP
jgi:Bacterial toxin 24